MVCGIDGHMPPVVRETAIDKTREPTAEAEDDLPDNIPDARFCPRS